MSDRSIAEIQRDLAAVIVDEVFTPNFPITYVQEGRKAACEVGVRREQLLARQCELSAELGRAIRREQVDAEG